MIKEQYNKNRYQQKKAINLWNGVHRMKTQKYLTIGIMFVIFVMLISACHRSVNPIVVIDGESISEAEVMLYLLQVKAQFEQVGGLEIWDTEEFSGGKTAEQVAKEGALDNLFKYKILVGKASSMGVSMDQSVIDQTTEVAKQYYEKISADMISEHKITEQIVIDTFLDFSLASEVEAAIKDNYEPTVEQINEVMLEDQDYSTYMNYQTEDILTLAQVKQIFTRTAQIDENSNPIPLSEEEQKTAYNKIIEAYDKAMQGEDFDNLIEQYSEMDQVDTNNEIPIAQLKKFFTDLSVGKISEIAQGVTGYYVFQVISIKEPSEEDIANYEVEFKQWEDILRDNSLKDLKEDAFNEIYTEWEKETPTSVNHELWDGLSIF